MASERVLIRFSKRKSSTLFKNCSSKVINMVDLTPFSNALGANRNTVKKHVQRLVEMDSWSAMERPAHLLFSLLIWIMRPSANTTLIFKTEPNTAGMLKVPKEPIEPNVHLSGSKGMQAIT